MKKTILFKAPVLTHSGYGIHSRQIARVLLENFGDQVKFMPTLWGNTGWILKNNPDEHFVDQIIQKIETNDNKEYDLSLQLLLPDEWKKEHGKVNIGITAGVETDKCSENWIEFCNKMNEVVVPSNFTKNTFVNSSKNLTTPITVIPEETYILDSDIGVQSDFDQVNNIKTKFNFLVFGQITGNNPYNDRKNIFFTLKDICEVFKDDPDVGIILKTNASRNTKIDREFVIGMLNSVTKEIRKGPFPKIYLVHGNMEKSDMINMYNSPSVKAMVSLSRGEGFGLPLMEAASAEVPIISVNWSGQLEYLNNGKFIKVDYSLKEVHESRLDGRIFIQGAKWADYDSKHFKKRLSEIKSSWTTPKNWARDLGKVLREKYSHQEISKKYVTLINKYL